MKKYQRNSEKGFTLVELAIVLVIIGLIVGGVLAGQDLIKGAKLQKTIKMVNDTNASANTFMNKYGQLPGDYSNGASFTTPIAISGGVAGTLGLGDGNGLVEAVTTAAGGTATASLGVSGETAAFYPELYASGLWAQAMGAVSLAAVTPTTAAINGTPAAPGIFATVGAESPSGLLAVQGFNSTNYMFIVGRVTAAGPAAAGIIAFPRALTPVSAAGIDSKLDDGQPASGTIVATVAAPAANATGAAASAGTAAAAAVVPGAIVYDTPGAANCVSGAVAVYNTGLTGQLCTLAIKAQF